MTRSPYQVLMPMHDGFDVLDFFGPLEFLSLASFPNATAAVKGAQAQKAFNFVVTSETKLTCTYPGVNIANHIDIEDAYKRLADFDMLIIPGGNSVNILGNKATEPMGLIKAFADLPPRPASDRIIFSVCTGALFLAKAGVLEGQTVTTNSGHMDQLRAMVAPETTVADQGERFVVNPSGGVNNAGRKGYRMMMSRGPGAGFDLTLWFINEYVGEEVRKGIEKLVEYQGRINDGIVL